MRPFPLGRFVGPSERIAAVDLHTARPADLPTSFTYSRRATAEGILDGFCVYFTARFDDETAFSTSPDRPPTSWGSPLLRVESRRVASGETIRLELVAGDLEDPGTWRWS